MKILMTTDTVGGVWTYSIELVRALAAFDVEVVLAAKGRVSDDQQAEAQHVPNLWLFAEEFALEWMDDPWGDVAAAGDWLLEIADAARPDVLHLNDYCHGSLAWNAPVLMVGHSCVLSWLAAVRGSDGGACWERYQREVRRGLQSADLVIAPSRQMLAALNYFYGPLARRRVISNGCDPQRYESSEKQQFIFSAGRFWDEAKNISTLAAAAPKLDWPVAVAGIPNPAGGDECSEEVDWLGRLSRDEMAVVYSSASIYALPAVYEPFGLTALEAALSGCALVLGDIPSLREIWGEAACYVPPRDAEQLATVLNHLARHDDYRIEMSQQAYRRGRQMTAARMAAEYYGQYRRLIESRDAIFQGAT